VISARSLPDGRGRGVAAARVLAGAVLMAAMVTAPGASAPRPKRPPPSYTFAGVPWLVPADTALARLTARGYQEVPGARDKDRLACRGRLFEYAAIATAYLDEQRRLVRWVVVLGSRGGANDYPEMRRAYGEVVEEAIGKYGPPLIVTDRFAFPFERGDGREDVALDEGKAVIRSQWISRGGDRLAVEMDPTCAVVLTYVSPGWAAIEARRKVKKGSDL
jgi:hypothetical protein